MNNKERIEIINVLELIYNQVPPNDDEDDVFEGLFEGVGRFWNPTECVLIL